MKSHNLVLFAVILFLICPDHTAAQHNGQEPLAKAEALIEGAKKGDAESQFELA